MCRAVGTRRRLVPGARTVEWNAAEASALFGDEPRIMARVRRSQNRLGSVRPTSSDVANTAKVLNATRVRGTQQRLTTDNPRRAATSTEKIRSFSALQLDTMAVQEGSADKYN